MLQDFSTILVFSLMLNNNNMQLIKWSGYCYSYMLQCRSKTGAHVRTPMYLQVYQLIVVLSDINIT